MAINSRKRLVSFRVTDDEYEQLQQLCYSSGFRSASELARTAISFLQSCDSKQEEVSLAARVAALEARLQTIVSDLQRVNEESDSSVAHIRDLETGPSSPGSSKP